MSVYATLHETISAQEARDMGRLRGARGARHPTHRSVRDHAKAQAHPWTASSLGGASNRFSNQITHARKNVDEGGRLLVRWDRSKGGFVTDRDSRVWAPEDFQYAVDWARFTDRILTHEEGAIPGVTHRERDHPVPHMAREVSLDIASAAFLGEVERMANHVRSEDRFDPHHDALRHPSLRAAQVPVIPGLTV